MRTGVHPRALEVDHHTDRCVHKSVLLLVVQADRGEFPRCERGEFLEGGVHVCYGSFEDPLAIVLRVVAQQNAREPSCLDSLAIALAFVRVCDLPGLVHPH